jgi:hypothetical protein
MRNTGTREIDIQFTERVTKAGSKNSVLIYTHLLLTFIKDPVSNTLWRDAWKLEKWSQTHVHKQLRGFSPLVNTDRAIAAGQWS